MPNCPLLSRPQHHNVLSVRSAQVCPSPALTRLHRRSVPTCTGLLWPPPPLTTPSRPSPPCPQHHSVPSVRVAQVCCRPAATIDQLAAVPTCTGDEWPSVSPTPSSPSPLLPQHHKVWAFFTPHVFQT